jgi:aminodeoxyfutalosine deaminase
MIDIQKTFVGEVTVLSISGRVDAISAPVFQKAVDQILADGNGKEMLLRLKNIDYISAAGLRVLRNLKEQTGRVCIAEPSDRVRDVLQITGLDASYEIHEALNDALHQTRSVVNAHTHLELGWLQKYCPPVTGEDFARWMDNTILKPFKGLSGGWEQQFIEAIERGIEQMKAAGITTVADISETGLSIQPLLNAGMHGIVYIELHGRDATQAAMRLAAVQEKIVRWQSKLRGGLKIGLSIHTAYSVHRTLWDIALAYARQQKLPLCIHVAEHPAEVEYLQHGTGTFADVLFKDTVQVDIPAKSPIAFLEEVGALALKPLLIHAVQVTDVDIALIKKYGCTVVHCPRSNLRLQCGRMPLEKFLEAGIPVMLGTDSLASSPSLNIFEEVEVAVALHHGKVDAQKIVKMVHGTLPV